MGTIFQSLEPETGFQLNLMQQIGYDVVTLGNQEYDIGTDKLSDIINSALKNGSIPQIVQSQMQFSETNTTDDKLAKLVVDKIIKPYTIIKRNGLKIGIFGIIGIDAQHVAPNTKPVTFTKTYKTAKAITKIQDGNNSGVSIFTFIKKILKFGIHIIIKNSLMIPKLLRERNL